MKLLFIILTVLTSINTASQVRAIHASLQPVDFGLGVRVDYTLKGTRWYNSLSYGDWGLYRQFGLRGHIKATAGPLIRIPVRDNYGARFWFSVGVNYHHIMDISEAQVMFLNPRVFDPISYKLGITLHQGRFTLNVRTDIPRWEPCFDIGYVINPNR
jgi:hypothetical protein